MYVHACKSQEGDSSPFKLEVCILKEVVGGNRAQMNSKDK